MTKDPVCNMNVDEKTAKYISEVNGQKYTFCSTVCKETFDKNPSKYGY
jgi:YHS domain-containing protein